jgi:hypothetical protein
LGAAVEDELKERFVWGAVLVAHLVAVWVARRWSWGTAPVLVVSATAAIVFFEAAWIDGPWQRERLWGLALVAALVLQIDWVPVVGSKEAAQSDPRLIDNAAQLLFLGKQYDTAINEIHKRLDYEQVLFGLKFTLIGGILYTLIAFIKKDLSIEQDAKSPTVPARDESPLSGASFDALGRSPLAAAFFWASVVVSAIIDARIQFNAAFIATLGGWVRQVESVMLTQAPADGWEHYLRDRGLMSNASYPFVRMSWALVTWLLFAVTVFVFVMPSETSNKRTRTLSRAFGVFAFGAFALSSIGFRPERNDVVLHSLIWGALGSAALARALALGKPAAASTMAPGPQPEQPAVVATPG